MTDASAGPLVPLVAASSDAAKAERTARALAAQEAAREAARSAALATIRMGLLGIVGEAFQTWWESGGGGLAWETQRALLGDLRWWLRWSTTRNGGQKVWPITRALLLEWLPTVDPTARGAPKATGQVSMATIRRRLWSIRHLHVAVQLERPDYAVPDPTRHYGTLATLQKWSRAPRDRRANIRTDAPELTPRRQRPALSSKHEAQIRKYVVAELQRLSHVPNAAAEIARRRLVRNWALLRVARDTMARRGELRDFRWSDWPDPDGPLTIASAKTDQAGKGKPRQLSPLTRDALLLWRAYAADWTAPIFTRIGAAGEVSDQAVTGQTIDRVIRELAAAAGVVPNIGAARAFGAHSTRIGMAIDLADAGASVPQIMAEGRWKSLTTLMTYLEQAGAVESAIVKMRLAQDET